MSDALEPSWSHWTKRYAGDDYHFGTEPAAFLAAQAAVLPPASRVLCVADGEGRNSVYLATLGHRVTAFDPVEAALSKARALAEKAGVTVDIRKDGIETWDWSAPYDAVAAIFIQFAPPAERAVLFQNIARAIRPGGLLLLHGYAPRQVGYGTGGPPVEAHMYTLDLLAESFPGWEVLRAEDYDAHVEEGVGHSGQSALIDFVARKPG